MTDWFFAINNDFSRWLWSHHAFIVTSWIAVLLVVYGDSINKFLKQLMRPYHYLLRLMAFVLLCTLGYSLLAHYGEISVYRLLQLLDRQFFGIFVISAYLILGMLAERKHHA